MRIVLLALVMGCGARRNAESLVLRGGVSDQSGGGGEPTCPWTVPIAVRLEQDTVWIDEIPWGVGSASGAEAFVELMTRCGQADAVAPFRDWRDAEARPPDPARSSLGAAGAALLGGAVEGLAVEAGVAASPQGDQLGHAIREQNLAPAATPAARPVDAALQAARDAFVAALTSPPAGG